MSRAVEAALPFWLDRPDTEALDLAREAWSAGLHGLWIGEMATYDAFALATAIGIAAPGMRLSIGPLPISVRTPAGIALGAGTVASLTGARVDVALGASSPVIVTGWHGRDWGGSMTRMRETIDALRPLLAGQRTHYNGDLVSSNGFRVRHPLPGTRIAVGAFGDDMVRLTARHADELVLNLATPARVARIREHIDRHARAADRQPPHLTVWVPAAVDPGPQTWRQVAAQLAVYLRPPGYGEMFTGLGFGALVDDARRGIPRAQLASAIPSELPRLVGAFGTEAEVRGRIAEFRAAGADTVAVVPATTNDPDDPNGRATLRCAARCLTEEMAS
ncbi:LLM class F420-dependent oxidoreductase [Mycolicibacterium sp.]|uniref:LLM class F420-dependent oxidoreductase n=1 Tax=Mycolicibacterium sp. TaxID=2320850 RepID=UPI003D14CC25